MLFDLDQRKYSKGQIQKISTSKKYTSNIEEDMFISKPECSGLADAEMRVFLLVFNYSHRQPDIVCYTCV